MTLLTRRASLAIFAAAAAVWGQDQVATISQSQWKTFLDWFTALDPNSFHTGQELFTLYKAKLAKDGVSAAEAEQVLGGIREKLLADPAGSKLFWNKHYERDDPQFRTDPNAFLMEVASKLRPGKALDLGMGEGRNSIFLARLGWDVTGVDTADVGVAKARKRAESLGLKINAIVQDADKFDFGNNRWDLVCLLYAPGANEVNDFDKRLAGSLKPGGLVVAEWPYITPKFLAELSEDWEKLGLKLKRLEYRVEKSDWGQPSFGRGLFEKT